MAKNLTYTVELRIQETRLFHGVDEALVEYLEITRDESGDVVKMEPKTLFIDVKNPPPQLNGLRGQMRAIEGVVEATL